MEITMNGNNDRDKIITEIRNSWRKLYPADKKNKGIICPLCGSGSGTKGTGITGNVNHGKPDSLKCWSCGFSGDVISLIMKDTGVDFNSALNLAMSKLGIVVDVESGLKSPRNDFPVSDDKSIAYGINTSKIASETITEVSQNYCEYYKQCKTNISNPLSINYLSKRGISFETAVKYNLGFDPEWQSPTVIKNQVAKGSPWRPEPSARIIIPISENHYVARAISPDIKEFAKMNETGNGNVCIFNIDALKSDAETIFVVEGVFDALSIIEVGSTAMALNSTSNVPLLLKTLRLHPISATLILCLDSDEQGCKAQNSLKDGLKLLNISYITSDITGNFKDPNDAMTNDKDAFITAVNKAQMQSASKPDNISSYIDFLMSDDVAKLKDSRECKTGFPCLDELTGGLYPGLYVIAATSSLGKTTFTHQISDNLAMSGHDVLFFSMEQSRLELVSKSLARLTALENIKTAVTSLQIRKGLVTGSVKSAVANYKQKVSDRLSIVEGNFNCNVSFIGDYIRRYINKNNCKPIVVIDYLQILQPSDDVKKVSVKETVDSTVTELKRISRENELTIFIISSVNRSNYLSPIDFESLKESGGIEYTADVIWGLQLQCLNDPIFSESNKIKEKRQKIRKEKASNPRKIELVCLKNRYGITNFSCGFDYYPKNDLFVQINSEDFTLCFGENPFDTSESIKSKSRI